MSKELSASSADAAREVLDCSAIKCPPPQPKKSCILSFGVWKVTEMKRNTEREADLMMKA